METYIVVKKSAPIKVKGQTYNLLFNTFEAFFQTEAEAEKYIENRMADRNEDDAGCEFFIEKNDTNQTFKNPSETL